MLIGIGMGIGGRGGAPSETPTIYTEGQFFTSGSYYGYAAMWYKWLDPEFDEGVDFTCAIHRYAAFPDGTKILWDVGATPPSLAGVYGYLHIGYGNYDEAAVATPITSRQVYTITDLDVDVAWSYSGDAASSILQEFWLTSEAIAPGAQITAAGKAVYEVGAFLRVSAATISYFAASTPRGEFVDPSARTWTVVEDPAAPHGPFYMFKLASNGDVTGTIHWPEMLAHLVGLGLISGNEWFNGIALGVEPHTGAGTVTLNQLDVAYAGAARVPWTITDLVATASSSSAITLTCTPAAGASSHQYRQNSGAWTNLTGNSGSWTLTGLTASTAYTFEVRGVNGTGQGAASNSDTESILAAGPTNLILNGSFAADDANWSGFWYSGKTVGSGVATFASGTPYDGIFQAVSLTAGKYYELTYTATVTAGVVRGRFIGGTNRFGAERSASGTYVERLLANSGNNAVEIMPSDAGFSGTIDNVSLIGPYNTSTVGGA